MRRRAASARDTSPARPAPRAALLGLADVDTRPAPGHVPALDSGDTLEVQGMSHLYLHGFGVRYGLPAPLALYLYAAGAVVVVSFVLVVVFARGKVGERATDYPRWEARWLVSLGNAPVVRFLAGLIGVVGLLAVIVTGFLGSQTAT